MAGTVRLYRTVSVPEYDDLKSCGRFRLGGGAEGKYFWTSPHDAGRFGRETQGHYHPDGYRVVGADVPEQVAGQFARLGQLDGIGPAYFAPAALLVHCAVVFLDLP